MSRLVDKLLYPGALLSFALAGSVQAEPQVCWRDARLCFVFSPGATAPGLPEYFRYGDAYDPVTGGFGHGQPVWYQWGVPTVGYEYPAVYRVPYIPAGRPGKDVSEPRPLPTK